jgi:hypothetical protein
VKETKKEHFHVIPFSLWIKYFCVITGGGANLTPSESGNACTAVLQRETSSYSRDTPRVLQSDVVFVKASSLFCVYFLYSSRHTYKNEYAR